MGATEIEFVEIEEGLREALGEPDAGTRLFRQIGGRDEFREWWDAVSEVCAPDGAISPGGASMVARVSRMGVYKRMKEGRITAFLFHKIPEGRRWSMRRFLEEVEGGVRFPAGCYIPVAELKSWGQKLESARSGGERLVAVAGEGKRDERFLWLKREEFRKLRRAR